MRYLAFFLALVLAPAVLHAQSEDPIQILIDKNKDAEAFVEAQASADEGDPRGHEWLGWMYDNARGVEADLELAVYHYRVAIRGGQNFARWRLGVLIDKGKTQGTLEEAVALFEAAAQEDFSRAVVSLAVMKATGRGTAVDYPGALENYMRAAGLGNAHGIQGVGVLLMLGQGVEKDPAEAAAWFLASALAGNAVGEANFQRAVDGMSEEEVELIIARANELANELGIKNEAVFESDPIEEPAG
ncbi:MAG: tetratricopeptide repeat protein [Pseudomonadota bacterium]